MFPTLLVVAALAPAPSASPTALPLAVMAEVERLAAAPLWPGFDPRQVPAAIFDGTQTWLFHHPHPPAGFFPANGGPGVFSAAGRAAAIVANSSASIGGMPTATVTLDATRAQTATTLAAVVIHETFHVYQREHHPSWQANEADLFTYPVEDIGALSLRRLETAALRQALAAPSDEASATWASSALALRRARFERIGATASAYERGTELNEGLAEYLQRKADATPALDALPVHDFPAEQVRARAYRAGRALALLLDRFDPRWQAALEGGDRRSLDELLAAAIAHAGAVPADLDDDEREVVWLDALRDVARLIKARSEQRSAFLATPGWRLVIVCEGAPLLPQGFDPMNLQRLGPREMLHTRWLKLGNGAGTVEVLGHATLTEGAGAHSLFDGVERVTITGLADAPKATLAHGAVAVTAEGVTLHLAGAHAVTNGETVTVTLPR